MDLELSKEFYSLSKINYLLKKELKSFNQELYKLELKKKLLFDLDLNQITNLNDFRSNIDLQIFKTIPTNGIEKKIAILKLDSIHMDRKLDRISTKLNKEIEYVAIDIQKRYSILNEEYFMTHFQPLYLETYKDSNNKLNELQNKQNITDIKITHESIKYKEISIQPSRKQNLIVDIKEYANKIIESVKGLETIEKHFLLNKYIKSIEKRLIYIDKKILHNHSFESNDFINKNIIEKSEIFNIDTNINSDTMIRRVLNGHLMVSSALERGDNILKSMYEEKIDFKIMEIGSKDMVLSKANKIVSQLENDSKELESYVEDLIQKELENEDYSYTDQFDGMF